MRKVFASLDHLILVTAKGANLEIEPDPSTRAADQQNSDQV